MRAPQLPSQQTELLPAHLNGFWWEVGNGLARTTLVTYLARELGADGTVVGLILACPHLVGVLRLISPWLLRRFADLQTFCLVVFSASFITLMALPVVCSPGFLASKRQTFIALVSLWGGWHLLMYLGVIALYAWFAALVPRPVRGEFLGRREAWKMTGAILGALAAGLFAYTWTMMQPKETHWFAYAWPAFLGAGVMLFSNLWLVDLPQAAPQRDQLANGESHDSIFQLLARPSLRQFLAFACWGAFANGISAAAVGLFAPVVLKFPVLVMLMLESGMRLGQAASAPYIGRTLDRWGNRVVLIGSQIVIACSLLFLLPAGGKNPWILSFTYMSLLYLCWVGYAGLNIGLPRATLQLSTPRNAAGVIALYYAATGLAVGAGAIIGGWLFESLGRNWSYQLPWLPYKLDRFQVFFLGGFLLRMTAILPLFRWQDPDKT